MAYFVYRSKRWITRNAPFPCYAYCLLETQEMIVPFHASTKMRLHEAYHVHNTSPGDMGWWVPWAVDEIRARTYPYHMMGKADRIRAKDVLYVFLSMVGTQEVYPLDAAKFIFEAMRELGVPLNKGDRSRLWWYARGLCGIGFDGQRPRLWLTLLPERGG